MKIIFKKTFIKQYAKLDEAKKLSVDSTLRTFLENPQNPQLKNHALKGKLLGKRAISAGFDLRIVFQVQENYLLVEVLAVGSHNQVY